MRVNNSKNQEAWLYIFAVPELTKFAEKLTEDVPGVNAIFNKISYGDILNPKGGGSLISSNNKNK